MVLFIQGDYMNLLKQILECKSDKEVNVLITDTIQRMNNIV